jgi:hypothetical protein
VPFNETWLRGLRSAGLVLCLSLMSAGCVTSGKPAVQRNLPPLPSYAKPVEMQDPSRGEDPLAVAARERAGRKQANHIIRDIGTWYEDVRSSYGKAE